MDKLWKIRSMSNSLKKKNSIKLDDCILSSIYKKKEKVIAGKEKAKNAKNDSTHLKDTTLINDSDPSLPPLVPNEDNASPSTVEEDTTTTYNNQGSSKMTDYNNEMDDLIGLVNSCGYNGIYNSLQHSLPKHPLETNSRNMPSPSYEIGNPTYLSTPISFKPLCNLWEIISSTPQCMAMGLDRVHPMVLYRFHPNHLCNL